MPLDWKQPFRNRSSDREMLIDRWLHDIREILSQAQGSQVMIAEQ